METTAQSKIFPYFEKGYPLRSRDLNAVFRRAEEEVRYTRTCLLGMGILYGLQVNLDMSTTNRLIKVSAGAGITSQGYLYCSHTNVELTHKVKSNNQRIFPRQFSTESFGEFLDAPAKLEENSNGQSVLEFIELVTTAKAEELRAQGMKDEVSSLATIDVDLKDKRFIIFFQVIKTTLSGCASCEKGARADLEVKYLLLDDPNWGKLATILICGTNENGNQANDLSPVRLHFSRVGLMDECIALGENNLLEFYDDSINGNFTEIKEALIATCSKAESIFGFGGSVVSSFALPDRTPENAQYIYDYLGLIIRAYNEFVSAPFARSFAGLPPETCFPKHLVLGNFLVDGDFFSVTDETRTPLYRPPFDDATDADYDHALKLYERLISLLQNHDFVELPKNKTTLAITPSRRAAHPLGMQAIPFYLKAVVRDTWRPESRFGDLIPHYDVAKDPKARWLLFQPFFDEADFYRIEGHIGQPLTINDDNKNQIEVLRDCLNLPFSIIVVGLEDTIEINGINAPFLRDFAQENPGLEHQGGVPAGGTFVVVVGKENEDGQLTVVADFCLPYLVKLPAPEPIADFEIENQGIYQNAGAVFSFVNKSKHCNRIEWRVDGILRQEGSTPSDVDHFEDLFAFPQEGEPFRHYLITLTAIQGKKQSVEKVTVVVTRPRQQVPPLAVFRVEELDIDNVEMAEDASNITITLYNYEVSESHPFNINLTFENLSENAELYSWKVNNDVLPSPTNKDNLVHPFTWRDQAQTYTVRLTAIGGGQSPFVEKNISIKVIDIGG